MKERKIQDLLNNLQMDFRDLMHYLNYSHQYSTEAIKNLINEWLIPELKELSELLESEIKKVDDLINDIIVEE